MHLPLALLLGAVAVQLVQLALAATDSLSAAVSSTSSGDIGSDPLQSLAGALAGQARGRARRCPAFVTLLGALFVSFGALLLWVELLVRAAAVYVATLFFPLAMASLVWPAVSQWCRRLVETVAALVLSKFVIVAVLSLAVGALGAGDGSFSSELAGGALLLLAAFAPFTLLRLVPMVEAGATSQLEGVRHRVQQAALGGPRSAANLALGYLPARPVAGVVGRATGSGRGGRLAGTGPARGRCAGGGRGGRAPACRCGAATPKRRTGTAGTGLFDAEGGPGDATAVGCATRTARAGRPVTQRGCTSSSATSMARSCGGARPERPDAAPPPMGADPPRYRFGPLERRGLIAGWRGGQIAVGGGGPGGGRVVVAGPSEPARGRRSAPRAGLGTRRRVLAARRPDGRGVASDGGAVGSRRGRRSPAPFRRAEAGHCHRTRRDRPV